MSDPFRIRRDRPIHPAEPPRAEPAGAGDTSPELEAGRRAAEEARDLLSQVNSLLGTFSVQDLVNQGGE